MENSEESISNASSGAAFPWILDHLFAYPGTYELPLRTMYTLNCASLNQQPTTPPPSTAPGNAFPKSHNAAYEESQQMSTVTAAAQLRANLMTHISQLASQPASLPPAFITNFVRKCFPIALNQVDFPQALTAMDYLKDLESRRRAEIVSAMEKLGIDRMDITTRDNMAKKYPGVITWLDSIEEKEKKIEAIYSQIYVGLRRWTLVNEMSLAPFNKANCIAMLNTLYPPMGITSSQFVQPTAQLTAAILSEQRNAFFRYITAVEKKGPSVLNSLMVQHKRPGDENGWPNLRDSLDNYLKMASSVIDECNEITGHGSSPTASSFASAGHDEDGRRKADSGISFSSSGRSSNRSSGQSHLTRPSTSSSFSSHSRQLSKEKALPEKPLPSPVMDSTPPSPKPAGSTLERIARELRRMRSKSSIREQSQPRPATSYTVHDKESDIVDAENLPPLPGKGLRLKRSLRKMRSSTGLRDRDASTSRPVSRNDEHNSKEVPIFDAEEMKLRRQAWEATQQK